MMKFQGFVLLCLLSSTGCEFNKSVNKDLITGLFTQGDGLSCEDVYLSDETENIQRTTFTYGEKFFLNFNQASGFKTDNGNVYPGMSLSVINGSGDTIMQEKDLYANNPGGFSTSPLLLKAYLTVASPMHSGNEYTLFVGIWDKKGDGTFSAKLNFKVVPNALIKVESTVPYDEIYLFSREQGKVITDNNVVSGEDIYMLFEGLSGFVVENNTVFPGLKLQVKDKTGEMLMNYADLFEEYAESGIPASDLAEMVSAQLTFPAAVAGNTVRCEITVWDKRGNGKVTATTNLTLK